MRKRWKEAYFCTRQTRYTPPPYSLSFLEKEYGEDGFFRCGKSASVNLRQTEQLRSQPGGRLLLTFSNGEKILVSRRYAAILRRRLAGTI